MLIDDNADLLRLPIGKSVDELIAMALVRLAEDPRADVEIEIECAAFVAELDEAGRVVAHEN